MGSQRHRGRRITLACIAVVVIAFLVATAVLFVWPSTNTPRRSDAIVVLGGSGPRIPKGLALAHAGYAPNLVISDPGLGIPCPESFKGVKVTCFSPEPSTTQGEAEATARMARLHHWRQIIVVSGTPQTTRARIRFDRCYHGTMLFDPAAPDGLRSWVSSVVYEWGALFKALVLQRSC